LNSGGATDYGPSNLEIMVRRPLIVLLIALSLPGVGWSRGSDAGHTPGDPWEKVNRRIYRFNEGVDRILIRPLSRLTSGLTPNPIGKMIRNFLVNLNEPVVIVNDLLQIRPGPALRSAFRLVINTTAGGLGAVDVAKALGAPMHPNGFGDTLGRWGVGPGPYIVVPVMGPFTVRDLFGTLVDDATLPFQSVNYPYRTEVDITVNIIGGLNQRDEVARDLDTLLEGAADPYATLRSSYLQSREAQVHGAAALPALPDIEDAPPTAPATAPSPSDSSLPDPTADPAAPEPVPEPKAEI
jgi:phospholipid-binding lipoprotein MlaA